MVRAVLIMVLTVLVTACGMGGGPNQQLIKRAIALEIRHHQQELSQQLQLDPATSPAIEINHIHITNQETLAIEELPAYHIQGTYDLRLKRPKQQITQQGNSFEIYLQSQQEGKTITWRLAHLQPPNTSVGSTWSTQPIPTK